MFSLDYFRRKALRFQIRMLGLSYRVQLVRFFFTGWRS